MVVLSERKFGLLKYEIINLNACACNDALDLTNIMYLRNRWMIQQKSLEKNVTRQEKKVGMM